MLSKIELVTAKFRSKTDTAKYAIQTASMETVKTVEEAARVLRIMILLHTAKDFPSALRLYEIKPLHGLNEKTAENVSRFQLV